MMFSELDEQVADSIRLERPGWMSRLYGALVADLSFVECGSLDVLLYCGDELAGNASGELTLHGPFDGP